MRIATAALASGEEVVALCNARLPRAKMPSGVTLRGVFSHAPYDCGSPDPETAAHARAIFEDDAQVYTMQVERALCDLASDPGDAMLIPTANAPDFRMLANLMACDGAGPRPRTHVITPYDLDTMFLSDIGPDVRRAVETLRTGGALDGRVWIHGENHLIAQSLTRDLGITVGQLHPPLPRVLAPDPRPDPRLRVGVFGTPRFEKGFDQIIPLVDRLAESGEADATFRFDVHCPPPERGYPAAIAGVVENLASRDYGFLNVSTAQMSGRDYDMAMARCDAVFLPYQRVRYANRGSGVAMEAARNGKIIVATTGTYPASLSGAAERLTATNPADFAEVFWYVATMREELLAQASAAGRHAITADAFMACLQAAA
ncbi:hypothetical protein [Palleronia rufa]